MKNTIITCTVLLGALIFASCSKVETEPQVPEKGKATLKATINDETKTTLSGYSVYWSSDDALGVWSDSEFTKTEYTLTSGTGTKTGTFTGDSKSGSKFLALYPYGNNVTGYQGSAEICVTNSQTYSAGGIANNLLPMVAYGTSLDNMVFQYCGGVVRIKLYADEAGVNISSIKLTPVGNNAPLTYARYSSAFSSYAPNATGNGGFIAGQPITLSCGDVELSTDSENPTEFNIVYCGSAVCSGGIEVVVTRSGGNKMTLVKSSSMNLARGKLFVFPTTRYERNDVDIHKTVSVDGGAFETLAECTKVPTTSVTVVTGAGHPLTSTDMTKVISIVNSTKAASISLSLSGSQYASTTFCTVNTNKIHTMDLPSNITELPNNFILSEDSQLTSINLKNGVLTTIGTYAFDGAKKLPTLEIPNTVTTLGTWIASGASTSRLTAFTVEDGGVNKFKAQDGVLYNYAMTKLVEYPRYRSNTSYTIPVGVTNTGQGGFRNFTFLTSIVFPASFTSLGSYNLGSTITEMTFNRETPMAWDSTNSSNLPTGGTLHVPTGKKQAYIDAWAWITSKGWTVLDGTEP